MDWFDDAYLGTPLWEIGQPQPEIVRLGDLGRIRGKVLDVGCGTGENALHLAARGWEVVGVDGSPRAIERARARADQRGITIAFEVGNALDLQALGGTFDTIVDCGLFHVFDDRARRRYEWSLRQVARLGGTYHMLCFSELEPGGWGPRRVSQVEIRSTFGNGWQVEEIRAASFATNGGDRPVRAWLARIRRT